MIEKIPEIYVCVLQIRYNDNDAEVGKRSATSEDFRDLGCVHDATITSPPLSYLPYHSAHSSVHISLLTGVFHLREMRHVSLRNCGARGPQPRSRGPAEVHFEPPFYGSAHRLRLGAASSTHHLLTHVIHI
jgi:hypothetical protein